MRNPQSVAEFCRETADSSQGSNLFDFGEQFRAEDDVRYQLLKIRLEELGEDSRPRARDLAVSLERLTAWRLSLAPSAALRWAAFEQAGPENHKPYSTHLDELIARVSRISADQYDERSRGERKSAAGAIAVAPRSREERADGLIKMNQGDAPVDFKHYLAVCASFSLMKARGCARTLQKMVLFAAPNFALVPYPRYVQSIIDDSAYLDGTKRAVMRILERMRSTQQDPAANLFDDFVAGFREAGSSPAEAIDRAWSIMAVYASGGPNIDGIAKLGNANGRAMHEALSYAFAAVNYLDAVKAKAAMPLYSMPREVRTTCDFGKSYHFWMTAFLTRQFSKGGKNADDAALASYVADVGYQMRSRTTGRDPGRAFLVESLSPANNKIRIDLAFAAAGAEYARQSLERRTASERRPWEVNVDHKIRRLLKDAGVTKIDSEAAEIARGTKRKSSALDLIQNFRQWTGIFSPKSALD